MPNHVNNGLYFEADNKERISELLNAIKGEDTAIDFEKIIPMPSNIYRGNLSWEDEQRLGGMDWYHWSIANWGTKWNAYDTDEMYNGVMFLTAWSAPFPVIKALSEMFPDVRITHYFADEDLGYNCGKFSYIGGHEEDISGFEEGSDEALKFACNMWGYNYEEYIEECRG
jgi:hypothetical protein